MTQERPKRKAAANKNYLDIIPDALLEGNIASGSASLKITSSTANSPSKPSIGNGVSQRGRAKGSSSKNGTSVPLSASLALKNGRSNVKLPINWVPPVRPNERFSHRLNLKDAYIDMKTQTLTCPHQPLIDVVPTDSTEERELQRLIWCQTGQRKELKAPNRKPKSIFQLTKGDYIYMVSEPPGEPYYIGRLMGFHAKGNQDLEKIGDDVASSYEFLIQWFYRPRDISKNTLDSRLLYASMHSDTCPINSFRGLVTVKHKTEVEKFYVPKLSGNAGEALTAMEYYVLLPNCFYFDKLFDRYMIKFYDIIKTSSLLEFLENETNNNRNYILALNKRFEFVFMEAPRTKVFINNFTSTLSTHCNICAEWCPSAESVTCSECSSHFHMLCLDPPLLKKPSRGFSWTCAPCSKKREIEHLSKKMLMLSHDNKTTNEDEILIKNSWVDLEEINPLDGSGALHQKSPEGIRLPKYEACAIDYLLKDCDVSVAERRLLEEWNIRYLGLHCRLEDAVDPDDRSPYPRASTSLGAKYQASNIPEYEDHPIIYYDVEKAGKDKKKNAGKRATKKKSEPSFGRPLSVPPEFEDVSPQDYPLWLQPRPKGYIERGADDGVGETCTLLWKSLAEDESDGFKNHDLFIKRCEPFAEKLGLHPNSPNFLDAIVKIYMSVNGDIEKALAGVKKLTRKFLKEPTLSKDEQRRFEAGVRKYGSELHPIYKEVKTQSSAAIVRYYYIWKKTQKGQAIWGNYPGRKKKKNKNPEMKVVSPGDAFADSDDDSSYENDKIINQKQLFECKHCRLYVSEAWYKITGFDKPGSSFDEFPEKSIDTIAALCFRCAKLWRRYAVYWEDPLEVERKNTKGVGGYKRKIESELVTDSERMLLYAERLNAVLSPETPKSKVLCSVITDGALFNNSSIPDPTNMSEVCNKDILLTEEDNSSPSPFVDTIGNLTARQLSLSKKETIKDVPVEPLKKKRKAETKVKTEQQNGGEVVKKRSAPKKDIVVKRQRKANQPPKQEQASCLNVKSEPVQLLSPVFNNNYVTTILSLESLQFSSTLSQILHSTISRGILGNMVDILKSCNGQLERPPQKFVPDNELPSRCSVCLEDDEGSENSSNYVTCKTCRVCIHASCADISNDIKSRLLIYWQCERCLNDMNPLYSTNYSCCLCMEGHDPYHSGDVIKSDYLIPVLDSGKWCHLTCSLFCGNQLSFETAKRLEFQGSTIKSSNKYSGIAVRTVPPLFLENMTAACQVCHSNEGALIGCALCNDELKVHTRCALVTPLYRLGFLLLNSSLRNHSPVYVFGKQGFIEPAMVCQKHDLPLNFFSMGTGGQKTLSAETRPLILLYLKDLKEQCNLAKRSGHFPAHNYLFMINNLIGPQLEKKASEVLEPMQCCSCHITSSPTWWPASSKSSKSTFGSPNAVTQETKENDSQEKIETLTASKYISGSTDIALQTPVSRVALLEPNTSENSSESKNGLASFLISNSSSATPPTSLQMASPDSTETTNISTQVNTEEKKEMFYCQKCHLLGDLEANLDDGDDFLKEIYQPLSCPKQGVSGPNDRVINIYTPLATAASYPSGS